MEEGNEKGEREERRERREEREGMEGRNRRERWDGGREERNTEGRNSNVGKYRRKMECCLVNFFNCFDFYLLLIFIYYWFLYVLVVLLFLFIPFDHLFLFTQFYTIYYKCKIVFINLILSVNYSVIYSFMHMLI